MERNFIRQVFRSFNDKDNKKDIKGTPLLNAWEIGFHGKRAFFQQFVGGRFLQTLLFNPFQQYGVMDFYTEEELCLIAAGNTSQSLIDDQTFRAVKKRLKELIQARQQAENDNDKNECDEEWNFLKKYLKESIYENGVKQCFRNSSFEKVYSKVRHARRFLLGKGLEKKLPLLHRHFNEEGVLILKSTCVYCPTNNETWYPYP